MSSETDKTRGNLTSMSSYAGAGGIEEPYSRYANANRSRQQGWEESEPNQMPRSPLAFDQQHSAPLPRQRRGTVSLGVESSSRQQPTKAPPTLSSVHSSSRPYAAARQTGERGVSVPIGHHRSPYHSSAKFFLTVIPPVE